MKSCVGPEPGQEADQAPVSRKSQKNEFSHRSHPQTTAGAGEAMILLLPSIGHRKIGENES